MASTKQMDLFDANTEGDWWVVSFLTEARKLARYRVLRGGKWSNATREEYIASTGDPCGGSGCDICRI